MISAMIATFVVFGILGMPIAFALGLAGLVGVWVGDYPLLQVPGKMVYAVDSFPLMSIPLFMLAGQFMMRGGIMALIVDLADALVGRVRGGLGHVTVLAAMGLSSVSGTAVADAAALGGTLGPSLTKAYGRSFSAALVASASNLGPIIPPSAGMILYAVLAEELSIGALFIAGVVPGIFLAVATMGLTTYFAYRRGYPVSGTPFSLRNVLKQLRRSLVVLLMPVLVMGGIVGGVFTATEGAAIAVVYSAFVGFFVTRQLKLSDLPPSLLNAAIVTGIVGALIAFASQMTYLLTTEMVSVTIAEWLQEVTSSPMVFTFLVMVLLLLIGIPLEANATFIMLVPIIAPIATQYGIDPVYFALVFVMNVTLGGITPPVGGQLFVVSSIWRVGMLDITKEIWPFIILQYAVLFVCTLFPEIVLFLPRLLGY